MEKEKKMKEKKKRTAEDTHNINVYTTESIEEKTIQKMHRPLIRLAPRITA